MSIKRPSVLSADEHRAPEYLFIGRGYPGYGWLSQRRQLIRAWRCPEPLAAPLCPYTAGTPPLCMCKGHSCAQARPTASPGGAHPFSVSFSLSHTHTHTQTRRHDLKSARMHTRTRKHALKDPALPATAISQHAPTCACCVATRHASSACSSCASARSRSKRPTKPSLHALWRSRWLTCMCTMHANEWQVACAHKHSAARTHCGVAAGASAYACASCVHCKATCVQGCCCPFMAPQVTARACAVCMPVPDDPHTHTHTHTHASPASK